MHGFFGLNGGFNPTGSITFTLYSQPDCTNPVAGQPQGVSGDGDYTPAPFTPDSAGAYYWVATYSGDSNNLAVSSDCSAEPVDRHEGLPDHHDIRAATGRVGRHAAGRRGHPDRRLNPTGEIVFRLYNGPDCHGSMVSISGVAVSGDGSYTSGPVALPDD